MANLVNLLELYNQMSIDHPPNANGCLSMHPSFHRATTMIENHDTTEHTMGRAGPNSEQVNPICPRSFRTNWLLSQSIMNDDDKSSKSASSTNLERAVQLINHLPPLAIVAWPQRRLDRRF